MGTFVNEVLMDTKELYLMLETNTKVITYFRCPIECTACIFPSNCTSCAAGYVLRNGVCSNTSNASHCVNNTFERGSVCMEYCAKKCKTCNETRDECVECAQFYVMDEKGECVLEESGANLLVRIKGVLNFFKRRGIKSMFLAVDDIWLYNYHQMQYDGTVKVIFETIQFMEEKQW